MNFNTTENPPVVTESLKDTLHKQANVFLGEEKKYIEEEVFSTLIDKTEKDLNESKKGNAGVVEYDKYKKKFTVGKEEGLSTGNIISARRWGIDLEVPETLNQSGEEKKLLKINKEKKISDILNNNLNKVLAENLAEINKHKDILLGKAYEKIAERTGNNSEQFGVATEQLIIGVLEGMSIDRPDLGFEVIEANAFQDVQNKIDFIIATKHKKRGVGINRDETIIEEKSIGIQFTINTSKKEHKEDQINKAKERGVEVDDIIYVEMDTKILQDAITKWKKDGKKITGPWKFISPEIRRVILSNLLGGLLDEEQKRILVKNEN